MDDDKVVKPPERIWLEINDDGGVNGGRVSLLARKSK